MTDERFYFKDYAAFLAEHLEGKVQKIAVNAGFTCPNRDGRVERGGCTYCNNQSFNPAYCTPTVSVREQLEEGIRFFSRKYPAMRYLAYFQAYSNTYAPLEVLKARYEEALSVPGVVGLVIATRPDCVDDAVLDYLAALSERVFLIVEYGIESVNEQVLRDIRRGHTFACSVDALRRSKERGLLTGAHLILGLPGETEEELVAQADVIARLPIDTLKLHQLQIIKGTAMAADYRKNPGRYHIYNARAYADLVCRYIERLPRTMTLERFTSQSPPELMAVKGWGMKNYEFVALVKSLLRERDTWQGKRFAAPR